MKVNVIQQVPYRYFGEGFEHQYESVVTTPYSLVDPQRVHEAYREALDELMHAARMGFDGLAVTEHAQSAYDMAPNPDILAAAVAYATEVEALKVAIFPLGRSLGKAREPLRVGEEYAMIDCITNGRLIAGFPVGLAYDANINNGVAPVEQRARFEENLKLVTRAWTAPEPFPWNGKFHQYPIVNMWPRPIQQPPPVWMTGIGTPKSMLNAIDRGYGYNYFGWFGYKNLGPKVFSAFWKAAEQAGHEPNPYRVGFLQAIVVAESDAQAKELYAESTEYFFRKALGSIPIERMAMPGWIEPAGLEALFRDPGDFGVFPMLKTITYDQAVEAGCLIAGGPKTVTEQLMEFLRECRVGNLHAMLQFGSMSHSLAKRNIELFAKDVLPTLRQLWTNQWKHHWWPQALGGVPAPAKGAAR